ncbi:MAG: DUF2339 domain-containing protein, partial [Flavobacteriaceae bacterium]|nr:DUF2339 domain-containing protein [Flavobacteriaceae bacterium]
VTETIQPQAAPTIKVDSIQKPNKPVSKTKRKSNLEKFIGENLINKLGIIITVIGVAIGAKYSIEHDLISPLTRIILGYITGLGLLGFGIKLKKNYANYSAVLVSGAMAIMYFISFFAYSYYDLIPQLFSFVLMFVLTAFTIIAALNYNKQIIAHIGLVGAYAVPFLLSDGSGEVAILFGYTAIINIGILIIAFKKYWKSLYYVSFILTWLMYASWYFINYDATNHFSLALLFLIVFFVIFYVTFLAYKLNQKEKFAAQDIILLLLNSFIFFGLGYSLLSDHETGEQLLGLFALGNGVIHFIVGLIIHQRKQTSENLFYFVIGLVLVFITMAVPIQLDGNWVTLFWIGEAALLFWIARTKQVATYERISYVLILLAFMSIAQDWYVAYERSQLEYGDIHIRSIFNIHFLSSMLFVAALGFITWFKNTKHPSALGEKNWLSRIFSAIIPAILLLSIYLAIRLEISNYFNQWYINSALEITADGNSYPSTYKDGDIRDFKMIWVLIYSLLLLASVSFLNMKRIKSKLLGYVGFSFNIIAIFVFLTQGLYVLSELRESFLDNELTSYFESGVSNIGVRYIAFIFLALIVFVTRKFRVEHFKNRFLKHLFSLVLHIVILWVLSSELLHWLDIAGNNAAYKLGLSILWGVYSLWLIVFGIWKNKQYLRIGAISLFGITLIKLFFYDISHLNTISKTIVFVSLGILLLVISFLYNKYKNKISNDVENES